MSDMITRKDLDEALTIVKKEREKFESEGQKMNGSGLHPE